MIKASEANKNKNKNLSEVFKKLDEYFDYQINLNILLGKDPFIVDIAEIMDNFKTPSWPWISFVDYIWL